MFFGLGVKVSPPAAVRSWMTAARSRTPSHVVVLGANSSLKLSLGWRGPGRAAAALSLGRAGQVARDSLGRRGVGARACARA